MNDAQDVFLLFLRVFIIVIGIIMMLYLTLSMIDALTVKSIGEQQKPCIDKNGDEFKDELCISEGFCSKWGFVVNNKCSEVQDD